MKIHEEQQAAVVYKYVKFIMRFQLKVIVQATRNWNNSVTLFFDIYNVFQWILVNFRVLI